MLICTFTASAPQASAWRRNPAQTLAGQKLEEVTKQLRPATVSATSAVRRQMSSSLSQPYSLLP
jgi:hypothetical protein